MTMWHFQLSSWNWFHFQRFVSQQFDLLYHVKYAWCVKQTNTCTSIQTNFFSLKHVIMIRGSTDKGPSIKDVGTFSVIFDTPLPRPCRNFDPDLPNFYLLISCNIGISDPPTPLKYSDVFYGWPLIMFFRWISLNLDAQIFVKQVSFLFSKLDSLPKVTLWRLDDNKNTFWDFSIFKISADAHYSVFSIQIWKMFGRPDGCGITAPFRDKGFIQCYEVNLNSKITE